MSLRDDYTPYFGDLHHHNAVGLARGSLQRTFDIAQEHLDFSAFMGHSQWHDIPKMPDNKHEKWLEGFEVHRKRWPEVQQMNRQTYRPGEFVTFNGYEWHSSDCGDYCIIFPGEESELFFVDSVEALAEAAEPYGAILCPHHAAYAEGWRGIVWDRFPEDACPIAETYSEHGNCFEDRGLEPMVRHSMGGRATKGTILWALHQGFRFGIVGGTDNHLACPGAYGEGLCGVWADELTRRGIWDALLSRRTWAVTGDRINVDFTCNGRPMGTEMPFDSTRELDVHVEAVGEINLVEIIKNGRTVHTERPPSVAPWDPYTGGRSKLRIRWGWGPWGALDMPRTCDWEGVIWITGGKILDMTPIIQSGPLDEDRRDEFRDLTETSLRFRSFTSRHQAFSEDPTKGVILEIEGAPDTTVSLRLTEPVNRLWERTLADLAESSHSDITAGFTSEAVLLHRLVRPESYTLDFTWTEDNATEGGDDFYLIRVIQKNGQMAWSSPLWIDAG